MIQISLGCDHSLGNSIVLSPILGTQLKQSSRKEVGFLLVTSLYEWLHVFNAFNATDLFFYSGNLLRKVLAILASSAEAVVAVHQRVFLA